MQDLKSLVNELDLSYKWKGFALSFIIVFIFVFLQNLGVKLSLPNVFNNNTQASAVENNSTPKIEREIPVVKTSK